MECLKMFFGGVICGVLMFGLPLIAYFIEFGF